MILLRKLRPIATNNVICLRSMILTSSYANHIQTKTTKSTDENVIVNIRDKLRCTEDLAKNLYENCPSLRTIDAVKNDTLAFLRGTMSERSIVENPELITMDIKSLEQKIHLLMLLKPKNLDDFVPLLILDERKFYLIVRKLSKESHEIEQKNRIYYCAERLKIDPNVILRYCCVNSKFEIFYSSFQNFRKKLNIVLDYGVSPNDVLNGLHALCRSDSIFVRRSEKMFSVGLPIKMWYYVLPEKDFDVTIRKYVAKNGKAKTLIPVNVTKQFEKRNFEKGIIVKTLKSLLKCDDIESTELYYNHVNEISELKSAKQNINYLTSIGIGLQTIRKNGFLLTMPLENIQEKLEIIKHMAPKSIEHFVPLMSIDTLKLEKYKCSTIKCNAIGSEHPIYYFSEKLNIPTDEVATQFAKHRLFEVTAKRLKSKLDLLLEHDIKPSSILNCEQTFRLSDAVLKQNISTLRSSGIDEIASYLIATHSTQKDKMVFDHMMEKKSLEGFENSMDYLAHRLGWNQLDLFNAMIKYPRLSKFSARKIKGLLDYILNETKFTALDIGSCLHIFSRNLDSIKMRIKQLTDIDAPITLPVLYYNKTEYTKFIQKYLKKSDGEPSTQHSDKKKHEKMS